MSWEALFQRRTLGVRLGLAAIEAAYRALQRPGRGRFAVHVVGTNGKGSTAAMLAHALDRRGHRVGLYTSPHLEEVGERVRIDGVPYDDGELRHLVDRVLTLEPELDLARPLSFFEVLTLVALLAFEAADVDAMVLETGLGGRLDATRVVEADVTLVTRIALDHQAYLGDTLRSIAAEKAAVLRTGAPCFSVRQAPQAELELERAAAAAATELTIVEPLTRAPLGLPGDHQRHNAALAVAALRRLHPEADPRELDGVQWPGRLETIACHGGTVVLDVAHNPDAIAALGEHMSKHPQPGPEAIVFGCLRDKDAEVMVERLIRVDHELWLVPPPAEAAFSTSGLDSRAGRVFSGIDDPTFVRAWDHHLGAGGTLWVCGSHYLVGALRGRALGRLEPRLDPGDPLARA